MFRKKKHSTFEEHIKLTELFGKADGATKASYVVMGAANLANKQYLKGILFLLLEISYVTWLFTFGLKAYHNMITLGTHAQRLKMDPKLGIEVLKPGDNSMLLLLWGMLALIITVLFILLYRVNLHSARRIWELKQLKTKLPTLREDLASLLNEKMYVTLMAIPLTGVLLFTVLPLIYMISIAFTSYDHNHLPPKNLFSWVGFSNFGNVISGDMASTFFPVLAWTLCWAVIATISSFFLGVILAMMINAKGIRGKKIFRTIFILTMAIPAIISLLIMKNMFDDGGLVNTFLMNLGIVKQAVPFFTDPWIAKITIIVVNLWIGIPATMLVTTGILQNQSQDQVEAAEIDGANKFQIFKSITFPQILFVMAPSLIQQFIGNVNNFNVIYLLTGGGPANSNYYGAGSTDLLITWLYNLTLNTADYNLASVIGILIFILSAVFSLVAYKKVSNSGMEAL
ncbi:MAG: sugar ABC transporter permease [Lactobacillaceae bacterium]|jgi:arabinogalactan oligomer/maltooligosaccharide transport system permease protein|nr:sugar ABC transporter permease [Lactobacillaceae bacterium]